MTIRNNVISGNTAPAGGGGGGIYCDDTSAIVTNNTISGNSAAGTNGGAVFISCSTVTLTNNIIASSTSGGGVYLFSGNAPKVRYCDVYSNVGGNYVGVSDQTGKNGNISKDPLFANAAKSDFHERSKGGRWNPRTNTWVVDTRHSPCIDKGDPASAFDKEPAPNGGRINMGRYGNTSQASKSKSAPGAAGGEVVLTATAASTGSGLVQITVNLTSAASVQVSVLNLAGREVAVLPERELPQGVSSLLWDGRSATGTKAPAGRYLVRVTARTQDGSQAQALAGLSLGR
jgi:hypothetical protein